jgi:hypothetical protein
VIDVRLCELAVDHCETHSFEKFVQAFHAAIIGTSFVPLGGQHDGGADGFEEALLVSERKPTIFLQASKTLNVHQKIRSTVRRLIDFGRSVSAVHFYFSSTVANIDRVEHDLGGELDVVLRIRDKRYIGSHINADAATAAAFETYLRPATAFLLNVGVSPPERLYPSEARTLCAFLGQEVERRRGNATLLQSVTDTLILWALDGTDPDAKQFLTRDQIVARIEAALPTARHFVRAVIDVRIEALASKAAGTERQISWYRKEDKFALSYNQRTLYQQANLDELSLYSRVTDIFIEQVRSSALPSTVLDRLAEIVGIVHRCIEQLFYQQGAGISLFIKDGYSDAIDELNIADFIESEVMKLPLNAEGKLAASKCVRKILRQLIYGPSPEERDYLQRLCHTYFLMFALRNEPRIVEYFNSMASKFVLYVGSDILIKALSEYHLSEEGQLVTNALRVIRGAGSKLILAAPALEEVHTHLRATILEFEKHYAPIESLVTEDLLQQVDRILIRAFFYAKHSINVSRRAPPNWKGYIGQFCSYDKVRNRRGREELQAYLCSKFGLDFETNEDMRRSIDRDDLKALMNSIVKERSARNNLNEQKLALNDALHVMRVLSRRHSSQDIGAANVFGYKTWWLTHERKVQRAAAALPKLRHQRVVMRPEFLLNYISLSPKKKQVAESYSHIFPTMLGVNLSRRISPEVLHKVLGELRDAFAVDEHRAKAKLSELTNRLATDQMRLYEVRA